MVLVEIVKRIRISADAYDIDCSNIIIKHNYIHAYTCIINNVDVIRIAIAALPGTAMSTIVSQVRTFIHSIPPLKYVLLWFSSVAVNDYSYMLIA